LPLNTYVIRRQSSWVTPQELESAAKRSARVGNEEMPDRVRWIRSYIVEEADGRIGSICIYQATDVEAVNEHARRAGLQADEVLPVIRTAIVRDDPQ
jgi:hypothetical protein